MNAELFTSSTPAACSDRAHGERRVWASEVKRHKCRSYPARAECADRLCPWHVAPVACNCGIRLWARGSFISDSANSGLCRPSRNRDRRRLFDRQPNGLSDRCFSSIKQTISEASRQGTRPTSQRQHCRRTTPATKAPILVRLNGGRISAHRFDPRVRANARSCSDSLNAAPVVFGIADRLIGSRAQEGPASGGSTSNLA
jgi:hypothetical protein